VRFTTTSPVQIKPYAVDSPPLSVQVLGGFRPRACGRGRKDERPQISWPRFSALLRLIVSLAVALYALTACQSVGSFAGWAVTDSSSLAAVRPPCRVEAGKARICRGDSNALQMAVSPQRRAGSLESWTVDQYRVHLTFTTSPGEVIVQPSMQFPLFQTSGISDVNLFSGQNQNTLIVSLVANSLGLDLIGASLTSPRGLSGVFILSNQTRFLEAEGQVFATGDAVASIWISKTKTHLFVQSKVESSQIIEFALANSAPVTMELGSFQEGWVQLCNSCEITPDQLKLRVSPGRRVPQFPFDIYLNRELK